MDLNNKLRIATRIHFALLRHYSEDVPVSDLIKGEADAREALWVCEASGIDELVTLARQFEAASAEEVLATRTHRLNPPRAAHAPRAAAALQSRVWAQDFSDFGASTPPSFLQPPTPVIPAWLKPSTWLRRAAT
jgi:hypothetical protein